jgi:Flp pilus assembly protein TadB
MMLCSRCHTEIADNALICFRCGVATTARDHDPIDAGARRPVRRWVALLALVAIAAIFVRFVALDQGLDLLRASLGVVMLVGVTCLILWWRRAARGL